MILYLIDDTHNKVWIYWNIIKKWLNSFFVVLVFFQIDAKICDREKALLVIFQKPVCIPIQYLTTTFSISGTEINSLDWHLKTMLIWTVETNLNFATCQVLKSYLSAFMERYSPRWGFFNTYLYQWSDTTFKYIDLMFQ